MTLSTKIEEIPAAWVGCLGCYNSGRLVGKWIPGSECDDLESAGLTDSAGKCLKCGADEFWVMDHENFRGIINGECSPSEAYDAAQKLEEVEENEREILAAWLSNGMEFDIEKMRDAYIGEYSHDEAMAEEYLENTGMLDDAPKFLARYFDYASYARDMMNDVWEFGGHYFMNN